MSRPPVTYPATLADLNLIADAACELDCLRAHVKDKPEEHARLTAMVDRLHETVERMAGPDADLLYAPDDGSEAAASVAEEAATC